MAELEEAGQKILTKPLVMKYFDVLIISESCQRFKAAIVKVVKIFYLPWKVYDYDVRDLEALHTYHE